MELRQKSSREVLVVAQEEIADFRSIPGVAAAEAAAMSEHAKAEAPGATTKKAAAEATAAYLNAAPDWCHVFHYKHFGNVELAAKAAAAAGAAAAFQRAAQAEAAGARATQRFVEVGAVAPAPDTNERIATEWATALLIANRAISAASVRQDAARARHEAGDVGVGRPVFVDSDSESEEVAASSSSSPKPKSRSKAAPKPKEGPSPRRCHKKKQRID